MRSPGHGITLHAVALFVVVSSHRMLANSDLIPAAMHFGNAYQYTAALEGQGSAIPIREHNDLLQHYLVYNKNSAEMNVVL